MVKWQCQIHMNNFLYFYYNNHNHYNNNTFHNLELFFVQSKKSCSSCVALQSKKYSFSTVDSQNFCVLPNVPIIIIYESREPEPGYTCKKMCNVKMYTYSTKAALENHRHSIHQPIPSWSRSSSLSSSSFMKALAKKSF